MEAALILADRIMQVIRESGANKVEAASALSVAKCILPSLDDLPAPPVTSEAEALS